jgi:hypothetical protein
MSLAGAMVTGNGFLQGAHQPKRESGSIYVDGEMPRDLMQERLQDLKRRNPGWDKLHVLCREDFPVMQPLNTPEGHTFILGVAMRIGAVGIIFDNRMSLTTGSMKEDIPWRETLPLVLEVTRRGMAQIWLDHTGHASDHIYGDKTKEWQMDTVALVHEMPLEGADIRIKLQFTKARRRRSETRSDFQTVTITLKDDQWTADTTATIAIDRPAGAGNLGDRAITLHGHLLDLAADPDLQPSRPIKGMVAAVRAISRARLVTHLVERGWFGDQHLAEPSQLDPQLSSSRKRKSSQRIPEPSQLDPQLDTGRDRSPLNRKGMDLLSRAINRLKSKKLCASTRHWIWPVTDANSTLDTQLDTQLDTRRTPLDN